MQRVLSAIDSGRDAGAYHSKNELGSLRAIAAWLSGYYNAKRNNRVIDLQTLEENMSNVTNYCSDEKNFRVPVMKAVEQVLGKSN